MAEENVQKLKASTRISIPFTKRVFFGVRETELAHTKSFAVTLFSLLLLLKMQRDVQIFQKNLNRVWPGIYNYYSLPQCPRVEFAASTHSSFVISRRRPRHNAVMEIVSTSRRHFGATFERVMYKGNKTN